MKIRIKKTMKTAQIVASIDDLLIEILLRLPIKSLLHFKSVSKHWLSIITNPKFALRRNPNPNPALGLFLPSKNFRRNSKFDYISFDANNPIKPPFKKLEFTNDPSGIGILQSCNGLLLCDSFRLPGSVTKGNYYVYNPTIKQLTTLPKTSIESGHNNKNKVIHGLAFYGLALAFDPAKSPHYKVVCVRDSEIGQNLQSPLLLTGQDRDTEWGQEPYKYQIEIYSSESGPWRASGGPFTADVDFKKAVYCNGAVNWVSRWGDSSSLYFNVDEERFGTVPMPTIPDGSMLRRNIIYFGESCDHLHLIEIYDPQSEFNVYEMKKDYSEWFVKYRIDLALVSTAFPEMGFTTEDVSYHSFSIFCLIRDGRREDDDNVDDAFLVLQIPGKAIRYNLVSRTSQKLCDFEDAVDEMEYCLRYVYDPGYQYIESLCCV